MDAAQSQEGWIPVADQYGTMLSSQQIQQFEYEDDSQDARTTVSEPADVAYFADLDCNGIQQLTQAISDAARELPLTLQQQSLASSLVSSTMLALKATIIQLQDVEGSVSNAMDAAQALKNLSYDIHSAVSSILSSAGNDAPIAATTGQLASVSLTSPFSLNAATTVEPTASIPAAIFTDAIAVFDT